MTVSCVILLSLRNASSKICRKNKTHFKLNNIFLRKWGALGDNVENYGTTSHTTDDNTIRRMRFACWINEATATHAEYIILTAFVMQQRLRERASFLYYTYIVCLVSFLSHVQRTPPFIAIVLASAIFADIPCLSCGAIQWDPVTSRATFVQRNYQSRN
jgi:hypothetical protein